MAKMQTYSQKRTLQRNIKKLMETHVPKMTSQMLADAVGCSRQSIDNYIFDTMPNAAALQSIADCFNLTTDELLGRSSKKHDDETAFLLKCSEYTGLSMDALKVLHGWISLTQENSVPGWTAMLSDLLEGEDKRIRGEKGGITVLSRLFSYTEPTGESFELQNSKRKDPHPYDYEKITFENNELAMKYAGGVYFLSTGYVSILFKEALMEEIDRYKKLVTEEVRNKGK